MNQLSEYSTIALITLVGVACSPEIKKIELEFAQQGPETVETAIGQLVLLSPYSSKSK